MEINEYLVKLFQTIKEMEGLNLFAGTVKLSRTEFRLLREIALEREKGKDIISSELARRLGITRSAVSQIVSKLEREGIVDRVASPTDKKIAYVRFSEHAQEVFEEQCRQGNLLMEKVVADLGEEKMKQLIDMYNEFLLALERARREN